MNKYREAEALEKLVVVQYEPRFKNIENWVDADVKAELARFTSEEAYLRWRNGSGLQPDTLVARFGYEDLSEGLLVDRGGNYICKTLREQTAASTVGTGNHGATNVQFNNANAAIGVGDSTTAAAVTQSNLQAATNKLRLGMTSDIGTPATFPKVGTYDATGTANSETYFQLTDTTSATGFVAKRAIIFSSLFGASQANFSWQEFGVFNNTTDGSGTMLDRFVSNQGTKTSGQVWQCWITITFS